MKKLFIDVLIGLISGAFVGIIFLIILALVSNAFAKENKVVRIALIDTGVNKEVLGKFNIPICPTGHFDYETQTNTIGEDRVGHGTQMAMIIGYENIMNNSYCFVIYKVLFGDGKTNYIPYAVKKAIENKVQVMNISLYRDEPNYTEHENMLEASNKGIKMFVCSGNNKKGINLDQICVSYPSCYRDIKNLQSVGALEKAGVKAEYSNYGSFLIWYPGKVFGTEGTSNSTAIATGRFVNWLLNR